MDNYTKEELQVHYEAVIRRRASQTKQLSIAVRVANNAKNRSFQKYMKELEQTGWRIDQEMGRTGVDVEGFFFSLDKKLSKGRKA